MSLSRTYFELASRYQSSDYNTETVYTGEYSADKMITIEVDSKRPYFNAPPTNGDFGSPITFINLVKDFVKKQGFSLESNELLDIFIAQRPFGNNDKFNYMDLCASYVDFQNHFKKVTIDDEEFFSFKKLSKDMSQLPEFTNVTLNKIEKLITNNFDFSTTNIYDRTILSYIHDSEALEKALTHIKTHDDSFSILFNMDNFNSGSILQHAKIKNIGLFLKEMNELDPELSYKFFFYENKFGFNSSGKFLHALDNFFDGINNTKSHHKIDLKLRGLNFIEDLAFTLHQISQIDSEFCDKITNIFKEQVNQSKFPNANISLDVAKKTLLQLDYFLLKLESSMNDDISSKNTTKINKI